MNVIIPNPVPDTGSFTSAAGKTYTDSTGATKTAVANQLRPKFLLENGNWVFKGALIDGTDSNTAVMATNAVSAPAPNGVWSNTTTYALGNRVSYLNYIFESRVAGNVGSTPNPLQPSTDKWLRVGPMNKWAAQDPTVESQCEAPNYLLFRFSTSALVTGVGLLNLVGTKVCVVMTDPTDGIVYSAEKALISTTRITDFWEWFNLPIEANRDVVFLDLPAYPLATVDIIIISEGSTAKVGVVSVGNVTPLGVSNYGTGVGIVDYSKVAEDDFGNRVLTRRSYAKRMSVPITLKRAQVDRIQQLLADYRQVPMVWIASEGYEATIVFGTYKSFEIVITLWSESRMNLEIQGFI